MSDTAATWLLMGSLVPAALAVRWAQDRAAARKAALKAARRRHPSGGTS